MITSNEFMDKAKKIVSITGRYACGRLGSLRR